MAFHVKRIDAKNTVGFKICKNFLAKRVLERRGWFSGQKFLAGGWLSKTGPKGEALTDGGQSRERAKRKRANRTKQGRDSSNESGPAHPRHPPGKEKNQLRFSIGALAPIQTKNWTENKKARALTRPGSRLRRQELIDSRQKAQALSELILMRDQYIVLIFERAQLGNIPGHIRAIGAEV